MKTIFDHIERVKGQPHHIRRRVAFGAAATGTAIIAFAWLAGSLGTGVFALKATSFAENAGGGTSVTADDNNSPYSAVRGVAGAAATLPRTSAPARIQIVDLASSTLSGKNAEQTTIPF